MGHTAVSATQVSSVNISIWQHGAKENNSNFATFNSVVYTKTSKIQMGPNIYIYLYKRWLENEYKPIINF